MPISTVPEFGWLPTKRTCSCEAKRLNCLSRNEMAELSSTVLNINKRHIWRDEHPARFIPDLPERYIKLFSHKGETVLDPFCGSGTTNVVAAYNERNSIGIDVNPYSFEIAVKRIQETLRSASLKTTHMVLQGDCREVMGKMPNECIDLIITSPPYFDVVDYKHDHPQQLGNIHEYEQFLNEMKKAFKEMFRVLKFGKYAVVNTQDLFKKDAKCPIHSDYIQIAKKIGFEIINVNIYILNYSTGGRLVYGYPVSYYPKNDHEYILIFKKE
ncbi:MAG: site-specific DNA-methyltransferase [Methanomassiliicoccales archaeon]